MTVEVRPSVSPGAILLLMIVATATAIHNSAAGAAAATARAPRVVRSRSQATSATQNAPWLPGKQTDKKSILFDLDLWNISAATQYKTQAELKPCVVVRFYDKQANALPLLLFSLFASAHPHLKALVIDTGKQPYEKLPGMLRRVNQASGKTWVHAYDKKTEDVHSAFPDFHHEDYGYVLTDMALEDILRQTKARSGTFQCDALTFTNADNLYSPHFIPAMLKSIAQGNDLVASHFVSHYNAPAERSSHSFDDVLASEAGCGALRSGEDAEFVASDRFLPLGLDLGAVTITAKAVARANTRFIINKIRADGSGKDLLEKVMPLVDYRRFTIDHQKVSLRDHLLFADGFFFYTLASHWNTSSAVLRKAMMLHL